MPVQPQKRHTLDEHLEVERSTSARHEWFQGEIFAMGGASEAHNLIVGNVPGELRARLRCKPCRVCPSDMRVRALATGLYTYPDVLVACGQPQFEQPGDTPLIPTLLVDALSESSEGVTRSRRPGSPKETAVGAACAARSASRALAAQFEETTCCGHWSTWSSASR